MASNFGTFLGSAATAFTQATAAKKEQDRLAKMAKLQGQLVEMQIQAQQQAQAAEKTQSEGKSEVMDRLAGTTITPLTPAPPKMVGGDGVAMRELPQYTGAGAPPQSLAAMMADAHGQQALLKAGVDPLKIQQEMRLQEDSNTQKALFESMQAQMQGGQNAGGRTDSGGNREFIPGASSSSMDSSGKLALTRPMVANPDFRTPVQTKTQAGAVGHALDQFDEVMQGLESLEGTTLQSGSPLAEVSSLFQSGASAVGLDKSLGINKAAPQVRQRVKKIMADVLLTGEQTQILMSNGTLTGAKLSAVNSASANLDNGILANALVMLDHLELKIKNADILGIPVEDPQGELQQIEQRRAEIMQQLFTEPKKGTFFDEANSKFSGKVDQAAQQLNALKTMSIEDIEALARSGTKLSKEVRDAAEKQWDKLNAAE